MKKLILFIALSWSALASAQTADQFIAAGTNDLVLQNLWGADTNFTAALAVSPTNQTANLLKAATRLLVLPQTPAGSNFLNSLGFNNSGRNIYNWTSTLPVDANGSTVLPSENTSVMIAFYRTTIMAALGASRTNLAMITDTNFSLSLTAGETSLQAVTVDYGDVLLLQALLRAAEFAGYTLNAQNFDVVLTQLQTLQKTSGLTIQSVLSLYPSLLAQSSASDLAASKGALTNAIALYLAASDFIRNDRAPGAQGLFNLSSDETNNEALFRTELTNVLLSLNQPVQFNTNQAFSIYAGAYFAGTHSLRSLVPQFNGDVYVNDTLPDYTFGGILVGEPACDTEAMLRKEFHSYAGIYAGDGGLQDDNGYGGSFAVFVNANQQATLVGTDNGDGFGDGTDFGVFFQFSVTGGSWQFGGNGVSGYGSIDKDGYFSGEIDGLTNGQGQIVSVYLNGNQEPVLGPFQNAAGYYTGSFSGAGSGTLQGVVGADGSVLFSAFQNGQVQDGGSGQINPANNHFTGQTVSGTMLGGTFIPASFFLSGTFTNPPSDGSGTGTFSLSRSASVPFDVPPVITTPPSNKIAPLGTNATFSLVATGSPPMCYQWYFNNNAIPFATTNILVVSNLQYSSAGTYSVTIDNVVGETNASATLTVVPETIPPVVAITNITPGMQVSNASFTVMGTATDNVAVAGVYWSLSNAVVNTGFAPAMTVNNWANWSTNVTLAPGTNTVRAYAVDTSGNVSTTNSATLVYILSAPLTVQTNGFGTISPNYNGTWLQIGKNYSMTATAAAGFVFTNWTGSITTNGATLQFTMASNLTFTANFADVTRPTLSITNLIAGQQVSNSATFTVKGTASDNWQVGNVWCQIDGRGWNPATNINNWTSWAAGVTLTPGTNVVQAYAVDTSGNVSTTNSVTFQYVVSSPLQVQMAGLGTLSPNYSNAMLAIGQNFSMTATPGTGFLFTNWTGGTSQPLGVLTNGTTLQFMMQSNLILQANFIDTSKPTLSITNLIAGQQLSNATFTVKGTASDNWQVSNVVCQINGLGWNSATNINNWTNWAAGISLVSGTNILQAYAVDTSGNVSTTNSVTFQYVVSSPLQVQLAGLGTLSPNYSNAMLAIGQNFSMTATPGTGFLFTNWTGGTSQPLGVLTNGTTLQFLMVTNLMLQANFVDVTKPTLSITNLTAGQRVSNNVFTVRGTATDNWLVSNVWCQLTGNAWTNATGTTNWSVDVTLKQGTNIFLAYAVDNGGNASITNSVSFQYVVSTPLQVQMTGLGTLSPNYSNAVLAVGTNYSMTATPGTGFLFTNWTGGTSQPLGVLTNGTTVQFLMQSNLILQANFIDTSKPTLSITNLTAGQRLSNATFTVKGTASDNWMVSNVVCQINGGGWNPATNINNWTNWAAGVTLTPGTNVVQAYAVDTSGNVSTISGVSLQFVVTNQLGVRALGLGFLSPNYSNSWLEIGRNYSMLATPASGFIFTNWVISTNWLGGTATNNATVQFMMQSNLTLQAGFTDVTRPVLTITAPTAGQHLTNALANVKGTASDNWGVTNVWYQLNTNAWSLAASTNGWTNWAVTLPLVSGTNTVQAYAVDLGANLSTTNSVSFVSSNTFQLQLGFAATQPMASNGLNFSLQVSPGLNGRIEASTNLVNWVTLTNFVGTNATIYFRDATVTNLNLRFYRAVTP